MSATCRQQAISIGIVQRPPNAHEPLPPIWPCGKGGQSDRQLERHLHSQSSLGKPAQTPRSMSSLVMMDVPVLW
jgi:hypothetical protein